MICAAVTALSIAACSSDDSAMSNVAPSSATPASLLAVEDASTTSAPDRLQERDSPRIGELLCSDAVGTASGRQPLGFEVVNGVVALPTAAVTDNALQTTEMSDRPGGFRLFAKTGLLVRADASFELTLHGSTDEPAAIGWGNPAEPFELFRVEGCPSSAEWIAFAGGYFVDTVGCYTITVRTPERAAEAIIGVGAACPGQEPPVPRSDT